MPLTKHFLHHPARKFIGLLLIHYEQNGPTEFDVFDDRFVEQQDIHAHGISIHIRKLGLIDFLKRCSATNEEITKVIDYIKQQIIRDDLNDIQGIGPATIKQLKNWFDQGLPDN